MATKVRIEMDNAQLLTLAASFTVCALRGLEQHLPPHAALAKRIVAAEEAIGKLAALNAQKLDEDMLVLGVKAWGHAMKYVANHIKEKHA